MAEHTGKGSAIRRGDRLRFTFGVCVEYTACGDECATTGSEAEAVKDVIDEALAHFTDSERIVRIESYEVLGKPLTCAEYHPPRPR